MWWIFPLLVCLHTIYCLRVSIQLQSKIMLPSYSQNSFTLPSLRKATLKSHGLLESTFWPEERPFLPNLKPIPSKNRGKSSFFSFPLSLSHLAKYRNISADFSTKCATLKIAQIEENYEGSCVFLHRGSILAAFILWFYSKGFHLPHGMCNGERVKLGVTGIWTLAPKLWAQRLTNWASLNFKV